MQVDKSDWELISRIGGFMAIVNAFFSVLMLVFLRDIVLSLTFVTIAIVAFIIHLFAWGQSVMFDKTKRKWSRD
jgi:ABC-type bacteriocin/lantibiotic exporter with double-glycine peptidase domain